MYGKSKSGKLSWRQFSCALAISTALSAGFSQDAFAQSINIEAGTAEPAIPFERQIISTARRPFAGAFLPDGRFLVAERAGGILLINVDRNDAPMRILADADGGFLDIAVAPDFATSRLIYFTHRETGNGVEIVLSRAVFSPDEMTLTNREVLWRQTPPGGGARSGGNIAFDTAGKHIFLTLGDTFRPETAQNPDNARGKLLRLRLDGSVPEDNPFPNARTEVQAQTWTTGHRNPAGVAFAPDGKLWVVDMGPRGGDELNLITRGSNYGWPLVSEGDDYDGPEIPRHATRRETTPPIAHWTPVISPNGLVFYDSDMFPEWRGSAFTAGLSSNSIVRISFDDSGMPHKAQRWDLGERMRYVDVAPDGAIWAIEDGGNIVRLTPKVDP